MLNALFPSWSNQKKQNISTSAEIHLQSILFLICETPTENEVETIRFGDKFSIRNLIDVKKLKHLQYRLLNFRSMYIVRDREKRHLKKKQKKEKTIPILMMAARFGSVA